MSCRVSEVHGCGLAALSYEKLKFILRAVGLIDIHKFVPTIISRYTVHDMLITM